MKKIYSTIFASLLGAASLMAQDATTFAFVYNGEVVPNGSVINVAETELAADFGTIKIYEMHIDLKVKNVSENACNLTLGCEGKENYNSIQFCPNNNCQPWPATSPVLSTDYKTATAPGAIADDTDWLHVSATVMTESFEYDGTVLVKAYPTSNADDCATVTVRFNTAGTDGIQNLGLLQSNDKVEVYNLCGKKIADTTVGLNKGIYIIRQGNTSRKVTIK